MILPDGSVIPAGLTTRTIGGPGAGIGLHSNLMLRSGQVSAVVYPDSPASVSRAHTEYRVSVSHRDRDGGPTTVITYANCIVAGLFGSVDTREYSIRVGAQVLILCLDGQSTQAYILAGLRDPGVQDTADQGHRFRETFNGITTRINAAGEWSLTFGGARTAENKLATEAGTQEDDTGTVLKLGKFGEFLLQDGPGDNFLAMDHRQKTWTLTAGESLKFEATNGPIESTAGGNYLVSAGDDIRIKAGGNAILESDGITYLGAGPGVTNQSVIFGDVFRSFQRGMHTAFQSALTALAAAAAGINAAGVALNPPSGPPLTPAAGVALTAAGAAMATAFTIMASAVATFESADPMILSKKVKVV